MSPFLRQTWAVSAVWMNMVGQGILLSYTTSLLPALQAPDSPIPVDLEMASWLSSSVGISGIPGFFLSSTLMEAYGRKIAHFIVMIPGILGWVLIYFGNSVPVLMVGRILGGMCAGSTVSLGAIVIGEYSNPKYRGMFLNLKTASVCLGGMLVHILGRYFTWRTVALQAMIPYVISVGIICTWPESPSWLVSKKQFEKSERNFYYLRGKSEESYRELQDMVKAQTSRMAKIKDLTLSEKLAEFFKKFTKKNFLKPIFVLVIGILLLEVCGRHTFPAYALQIIGEITGNKSDPFYYTMCIDVIITMSAFFSSILVKVMKRRVLLFSSGFAATFVLLTVCLYLFLVAKKILSPDYPWIPISLFVVYFILANLGCTPIPLAFLGELFPLEHRGAGSSVAGIFMSIILMFGLLSTPHLLVRIQVYGTFAVYGVAMGLCLVILYFTLPETKDRTLQEIEDYFNYGKFKEVKEVEEPEKTKMLMS